MLKLFVIISTLFAVIFSNLLNTKFQCRELFDDCDVNYPLDCCSGLMCRSKTNINERRNPAKCYSR